MNEPASVSAVIPTYNRRARLHRVLTGLADQTYRGTLEIVVVSDGSTDGTADYLRSDRVPVPVVAVQQENAGPAAARNHGIKLATGELIIFIDDDVVPDRHFIESHVSAHAQLGENAIVIGPMLNPPDHHMSMWVRWEQAMLAKQYRAMEAGQWRATERQFYTGNASVRRRHLIEAGGFDESLLRGEDVELAYRLRDMGLEFEYEPAAAALHYAERSFESWKGIGRSYGRNDVIVSRRPGREVVLQRAIHNYDSHSALIRVLVRASLARPAVGSVAGRALIAIAHVAESVRMHPISRRALSAVYAIAYFGGLVEELGGREDFERLCSEQRRLDK